MSRRYFLIGALLVLAAILAGVLAYPHLPATVPSHWNARGQVNGYAPRWTIPIVVPGMMTALLLLWAVLPSWSPKQFEVTTFKSTYELLMLVAAGFLAYVQALMIWAGLSGQFDMSRAMLGGICLLIAVIGSMLGRVRRNFWVGIRTPWTIASERVWDDTHRWAARAFIAAGLLGLVLALLTARPYLPLVVIVLPGIASVIYSLLRYKGLQKRGEI